ncbi:MAG: DUF2520 domain-containing protein [Myxococcales bacterium]|nr:DUF2520 domain-containing protein [Myxococcales bacterium]
MRRLVVVGRGKVGRALAAAARARRLRVVSHAARALPELIGPCDLVVLASRDPDLPRLVPLVAAALRAPTAVVHCSGALSAEVLGALRSGGHAVGAMHPLASFATARQPPALEGVALVVSGDAPARRMARRLGRKLGMCCFEPARLDPAAYHAAAAIVANGSAALAAAAEALLTRAGFDPSVHGRLLGPLLGSVGENITRLGPRAALSGPVRRGDVATIERHLAVVGPSGSGAGSTNLSSLYRALALAQLPVAEAMGEAPEGALARIRALVEDP